MSPGVPHTGYTYLNLLDSPELPQIFVTLIIIHVVRLSLLTMTNLNHVREMLLFVCSKMAD